MTHATRNRQPAGTSIGGQWAPGAAGEVDDDLTLNDPTPSDAGFGDMTEREVVDHVSTCVESTYRRYSWDRNSIIKGWSIDDVKGEVILKLYEAKAKGVLDNVKSPKSYISTTAARTISGNLIYDGMRSYDRKLSNMAGDRVKEIENSTGHSLSQGEYEQVVRDMWHNWDSEKHGPKPSESSVRLICGINARMHQKSIHGSEDSDYTPDYGFDNNLYGHREAETDAMSESTVNSDDVEYFEKMSDSGKKALPSSLRVSAVDTLVTSQGGPEVRSESLSPQYADKVSEIGAGRAREMADSYLDGSIDNSTREAFLAPWGGTKSVTSAEADALAQSISSSNSYADDLWSTALDASRKTPSDSPSA